MDQAVASSVGKYQTQRIGLRENLRETIDFPMKIMGLKPVKFPLNQSIDNHVSLETSTKIRNYILIDIDYTTVYPTFLSEFPMFDALASEKSNITIDKSVSSRLFPSYPLVI